MGLPDNCCFGRLFNIFPGCTPSHSDRISNLLLHLSWANQAGVDFGIGPSQIPPIYETAIPPNTTKNRLLAWCILLGSPVEEILKFQDYSYDISLFLSFRLPTTLLTSDRIQRILSKLLKAIISATNGTDTQRKFIPRMLLDLLKWENRPDYLMMIAYNWCSIICENSQRFEDWEGLLLSLQSLSLEHGTRVDWGVFF